MSVKETNLLQEAVVPIDNVDGANQIENTPREKPLSRVNRILTEEDLKSPGVRKMLLGQLDEYEQCKSDLNEVNRNFHSKDKEGAVLTERIIGLTRFDWLYSTLLTFGSILIGFYASQPDKGIVLLIIGVVGVIMAFGVKFYRSHENTVQ